MIDYYAELNLRRQDSVVDINKALSQLESTWKRREITNPEKATIMLALIIQARKAFDSEASRREYDKELTKSKEKPTGNDPNTEREQQFKKWYDDARSYYDGRQYDLAKTAVEKALSYYDQASDNDAFLSLSANVYSDNQNYTVALEYINKAIIINPDDAMHYISKVLIYGKMVSSGQRYNNLSEGQLIQNSRDALNHAILAAHRQDDKNAESVAYGLLSHYYYYVPLEYKNSREAKEYAEKAVEFGDIWGHGKIVLEEIENDCRIEEQLREKERKRQEEQRKKEELHKRELDERKRAAEKKEEFDKKSRLLFKASCVLYVTSGVYLIYDCLKNADMSLNEEVFLFKHLSFGLLAIGFLTYASFREGGGYSGVGWICIPLGFLTYGTLLSIMWGGGGIIMAVVLVLFIYFVGRAEGKRSVTKRG